MHFKNFDLNLLVALDAVLSERNVTRASEKLCVSQPATSNALQRIREFFGDPILVRRGREMELTPLGQALVVPVRDLLHQAERVLNAEYQFDPAVSIRPLKIAMSDYCITVFVGALTRLLSAEAPGIRLEIVPLSDRTIGAMLAGDIDMCVSAHDLRLFGPDHDVQQFCGKRLFSDDFVCVVDAGNQKVGDTLDLETYLALPHAITRFGQTAVSIEEEAVRRLGLDLRIGVVTATFSSMPSLIAGTPMVATIQRRLADHLCAMVPIRSFKPPVAIPGLEETLHWHPRFNDDPAHTWLRQAMVRAAEAIESPAL